MVMTKQTSGDKKDFANSVTHRVMFRASRNCYALPHRLVGAFSIKKTKEYPYIRYVNHEKNGVHFVYEDEYAHDWFDNIDDAKSQAIKWLKDEKSELEEKINKINQQIETVKLVTDNEARDRMKKLNIIQRPFAENFSEYWELRETDKELFHNEK
jgi:hypothetical protein